MARPHTLDHAAQVIAERDGILITRARKGDAETFDALGQIAAFDPLCLGRHGPAVVLEKEKHREIPAARKNQGFVQSACAQRPVAQNRDGDPGLALLSQGPCEPGGE